MTKEEALRERKFREWGTREPRCAVCGEDDWRILRKAEQHHIAGGHSGPVVLLCPNCHSKASSQQQNWPAELLSKERTPVEAALGFFMGLLDLLERLVEQGRKFLNVLYQEYQQSREC